MEIILQKINIHEKRDGHENMHFILINVEKRGVQKFLFHEVWEDRDILKVPVKTGMEQEVRLKSQFLYGERSNDPLRLRPRAMPR